MATLTWNNPQGGFWQTGSDWTNGTTGTTGSPPGAGDEAVLTGTSSDYTVQSNAFVAVQDLELAAPVTLDITSGSFEADTGGNSGAIVIENGNLFTLGFFNDAGPVSFSNSGTIEIEAGGAIASSNGGSNILINDGSIIGAGQLGDAGLGLTNGTDGIIDATAATALTVNVGHGNTVTNDGTIEGTGTGGLVITGNSVIDSAGRGGGTVGTLAANGGGVMLNGATLLGGTLSTSGGGVIETTGDGGTLDGTMSTLTNSGSFMIGAGTVLYLLGSIDNTGTFSEAAAGNPTQLVVAGPTVMLAGHGQILLSNSAANYIDGTSATDSLVNVDNTISGSGQLGNDQLSITNEAGGVVDATHSTPLTVATLGSFINAGLLEATARGTMLLSNTAFDNSGGTIEVKRGTVTLAGSTVQGGTIQNRGGALQTQAGTTSTLDDGAEAGTITLSGALNVVGDSALILVGTLHDAAGTLETSGSSSGDSQILISGTVTLQGGGSVSLSSTATDLIQSAGSPGTLVNADNIIRGAGALGDGNLAITNEALGVIEADVVTATLTVASQGILVNAGTLEATAGGTLTVSMTTVDNTGVLDAASKSVVTLSGASIEGGTVEGRKGVVQTGAGSTSRLDGSTAAGAVSLVGLLDVVGNSALILAGTLHDTAGTLATSGSASGGSQIFASGTVTLAGGGSLTLSSTGFDVVQGAGVGGALVNAGNTISGAGSLGNGGLAITNEVSGVIDANSKAAPLTVMTAGALINEGRMEATSGGTLVLLNSLVDNSGGTIAAYAATVTIAASTIQGGAVEARLGTLQTGGGTTSTLDGSTSAGAVTLIGRLDVVSDSTLIVAGSIDNRAGTLVAADPSAYIELSQADVIGGAVLNTLGGSVVTVGSANTLDGATDGSIAVAGMVAIANNTTLSLTGTINDAGGTLMLSSTGGATGLLLVGDTTLTGSGSVQLSNSTQNFIQGAGGTPRTLTNDGNTIEGAGTVGPGLSTLINRGSIIATSATNQLVIDLGGMGHGTNAAGGLWEGKGAAGLVINDGTYTNSGTIEALDSSSVSYSDAAGAIATDTNLAGGVLTGGNWEAVSSGKGATITLTGGKIVTDAANLILSGAGSSIESHALTGTRVFALESTLSKIAKTGTLSVEGGRAYNAGALAIVDDGTLQLGGAGTSFAAASITVAAGGVLSGNGMVEPTVTDDGTVTASGGLLDLTHGLTGTGTATIAANAMLEVVGSDQVKTTKFVGGDAELTLSLTKRTPATTSISGFAATDTIDLAGFHLPNNHKSKATETYRANTTGPAGGVLTVTVGKMVAKLTFVGNYTTLDFQLAPDSSNTGTAITFAAAASLAADLTSVGGFDAARWQATAGTAPPEPGIPAGGTAPNSTAGTPDLAYAPTQHL